MLTPATVREIRARVADYYAIRTDEETYYHDGPWCDDVAALLEALEDAIVEIDCHPRHSRAVTYAALLAALREPLP